MLTNETTGSFLSSAHAWIVSDGKAGNETQCLGVADALGVTFDVKHVAPKGLYRFLAPYGPVDRHDRFGRQGSPFSPPWPQIAIGCGRLTTPYIRALRKANPYATYTVILLDPKTSAGTADLFWVPEHDRRRGLNVITTLTSPHRYSPQRLAQLRANIPVSIAALPSPRVAVLIGGPNGDYRFSPPDVARLVGAMADLTRLGAGLMITVSRRTPNELAAGIEQATRDAPRILWQGDGPNPYPDFLAHADAFLVTADSVNMTGEACATGRPVHVFHPSGGSPKFDRFHASLQAYGATRPLIPGADALAHWSYEPLYSARDIAGEIGRRYQRRRDRLGSICGPPRSPGS